MEEGKNAPANDEQKAAESLRSLYLLTAEESETCDPLLFADRVGEILEEGFCGSRFYGVLLAIHEKQGGIDTVELAGRIKARLLSSLDDPEDAAAFLAGIFLAGRDILFSGKNVLEEIDRVSARMDDGIFTEVLPAFREAFTVFLPAETDRLGRMAAELYGASADEVVRGEIITREELTAGMILDRAAASAMEEWGL
jgi:hypothetical protein